MSGKPFFDTNVVLYAFSDDGLRGPVAESLLAAGGSISVQILNEFVDVTRRKFHRSWDEIGRSLAVLRVLCSDPEPLTTGTHEEAVRIARQYGYSIFDALVIAAALHAGAGTLYSEDMRDGHVIEGLTIRNPFSPAPAY